MEAVCEAARKAALDALHAALPRAEEITESVTEVLRFVEEYTDRNGYSPTLQEIADRLRGVFGEHREIDRA